MINNTVIRVCLSGVYLCRRAGVPTRASHRQIIFLARGTDGGSSRDESRDGWWVVGDQ